MRLYIVLILTAVAMAFATGYFALFLQGSYTATEQDIAEISRIKEKFQRKVLPKAIIHFNSIYYSRDKLQLLDPIYTLANPGLDTVGSRYSSDRDCFKNMGTLINQVNFEKGWIWEEYRCGKRKRLPTNFFVEAPYIHPSGKSYALLAFNLGKQFSEKSWVREHLPYFHVTELTDLRRSVGELGGIYDILEGFDNSVLSDIVKGKGSILTKKYLLAKLTYRRHLPSLDYRVYVKEDLVHFLRHSAYSLHNYRQGKTCFYKDGDLCWDYNVRHIFRLANKSTITFFFGLILIIAFVVRLLLVKIKNQRFEDQRRRLALQVLTHEFRTPITSMLLIAEQVNKKMGKLDEEMQDSFLRLSSEIYRLQRLTEMSRNYMRAQKDNKMVQFNYETIESVNDLMIDVLDNYTERYGDQFELSLLKEDISFCLDPYWLSICIKNLVENAIVHGELPIQVFLRLESGNLKIQIRDNGFCQFDDLDEISTEFVKGNKSTGTGLGLNIVKRVIQEMKGKLLFEVNPTTFTLILTQNKDGK